MSRQLGASIGEVAEIETMGLRSHTGTVFTCLAAMKWGLRYPETIHC